MYHYQNKNIDKRILRAFSGKEHVAWMSVLKVEFERYLYFYPFLRHGYNKIALEIQEEYFGCIGWEPPENPSIRLYKLNIASRNYLLNSELNELEVNPKNDELIAQTIDGVRDLKMDILSTFLSRI